MNDKEREKKSEKGREREKRNEINTTNENIRQTAGKRNVGTPNVNEAHDDYIRRKRKRKTV